MVLRDPLFLVSARTGSSDNTDWCTDLLRGLALLGLRCKRAVDVEAKTAQDASDDKVCREAVEVCTA